MYRRKRTTEIIIHCSATIEGRDYTVNTIRNWHVHKKPPFEDIGYHYVIYRNGEIHTGRMENLVGAHCTGHNSYSIGICYIGGLDTQGHLLVNQFDKPLVDLCGVITRTTSNRVIQDNSNFPQDGDTCMYGVYPEDASYSGKFYEYAYEQGCKYSILSEESPYSNWTNGVFGGTSASPTEEYTDGILREQVQYIFNTVLRLTKAASIQYYKD